MALIVEDGTGLSTAEAYASVVEADAYFVLYPNPLWTGSNTDKEAALRQGARFLDTRYRIRAPRKYQYQALAFPADFSCPHFQGWRPRELYHAQCEAAVRALSGALRVDRGDGEIEFDKVGPLATKFFSPSLGQTIYTVIDDLMQRLTYSGLRVERG